MYSSSSDQVDYKVIRDGNERKIEGFISIVLQKFDIPIEISGTTSRGSFWKFFLIFFLLVLNL